jgi:hypothetical protein
MKKNIAKLATLPLKYISGNDVVPEGVLQVIKTNQILQFMLDLLSPRDLAILCFLTTLMKKGKYKEGMEHIMDQFLFSYSIVQFYENTEEVDCSFCDGDGTVSCDTCYGEGFNDCHECDASGSETCSTCDGDGEDGDGNPCEDCQGNGQVDCGECDGDGRIECSNCGGSGNFDCYECDGRGHTDYDPHTPFRVTTYLSWNPKFREKLRQLSDSEKNIGINYKLDPYISMRVRISDFNHEDSETFEIGDIYENGTYIGGIEENPEVFTYGNDIWVKDPTPDEKFKG